MFDRGIKKDKDHYPEFKEEEKNWDAFCRSVEVTADTHGTSDVIDTTYVLPIGDNDTIGLFARKNRFMYSIFEAKIKTYMGISIVRSHETDRNAQTVWRKLVDHQTTSTVGALTRESLLAHLTTFKLDTNTWRGTHVSFIVNFQDKIQEYECLTPPADHYSDELKRTLLMQAVSQVRDLAAIKTQLQLEVVQGCPMPNFAGYVGLILSTYQILDQRLTKTAARAMVNKPTSITANTHDFKSEYEEDHQGYYENYSHEIDTETFNIDTDAMDLEIYHAQHSGAFKKVPNRFNHISLDRATWHNLPQEDKAKWDTLLTPLRNFMRYP
jgi:hypothetical protein